MNIIPIGHNNFIPKEKVLMILQINSRPLKQLISRAGDLDKLIDASSGKKRKSLVLTTDGFVVISSISPKTLAERYNKEEEEEPLND